MTTRDHIIEKADQLFYQQGFDHTSFADIARAVKISRGNFYYHFQSKDEILDAVINARLTSTRTMLAQWEADSPHPADRIRSFIHILITNQDKIMAAGCPVGTLCTELTKLSHTSKMKAKRLFTLFHTWLRTQFVALGHTESAGPLAMHILARSQGVAVLANAFQDEVFVRYEVKQMCGWLDAYIMPSSHNNLTP